MINTHVTSTLKVQNRTAGDNASVGDKSVDRVDNQPLKGMLFDFNHGNPRLKFMRGAVNPLSTVRLTGISLIRSAEIGGDYQNIPAPGIWSNCSKSSYQIMQPGQIKKTSISYVYKGKFVNFLKKFRCDHVDATFAGSSYGRSQLLCLEEKLRTVGTNPVTIQYERELKVGTFTKASKPGSFTSALVVTEFNNVPV
jgi:hypothetical protein